LLKNRPEDALANYGFSLSKSLDPGIFLNIGIAHCVAGDTKMAEDAFLSAMRLYPNISEAEKALGLSIAYTEKEDEGSLVAKIRSALYKALERLKKKKGLITAGVREIKGDREEDILMQLLYWSYE
jgi:tetratricopeptide (TPR) repeat protein